MQVASGSRLSLPATYPLLRATESPWGDPESRGFLVGPKRLRSFTSRRRGLRLEYFLGYFDCTVGLLAPTIIGLG